MRVFFDMDGVLADFVGGTISIHSQEDGPPADTWDYYKSWGLTASEFWAPINDTGEKFWAELAPIAASVEAFKQLQGEGCDLVILTSPSDTNGCLRGKRKWIEKHLGADVPIAYTAHKEVFANPNAILIDDRDENIDGFTLSGGKTILFPQPWNSNHDTTPFTAQDIVAAVKSQFPRPETILTEAQRITGGDRQASYGPPDQDFRRTANAWRALFGWEVEPWQVAGAMIALKLSRQGHQKKRDNWTDIAGYARCGSICDGTGH